MIHRLAIGAGEASGDRLAAAIIEQIVASAPELELCGVTGPAMRNAGVRPLADIGELSVMGLTEVLRHLPRLMALRRRLIREVLARRCDAYIGVDAPDFNLGLARQLRRRGLLAVQVVAPGVWAWRRYRIRRIARSVDLLLTLFPFEPPLFEGTGLDVRYIGHPLADEMPMQPDRARARHALGLEEGTWIALLPGSRPGEIQRHAGLLCALARRLGPGRRTLLLLNDPADRARFAAACGTAAERLGIEVRVGRTREGLTACDVAVAASGTVTLEALLARTPQVVYYRLPTATWALARGLRLVHTPHVSLPNVLAGGALVPERIQHAADAERLLADVEAWLADPVRCEHYRAQAARIHRELACNAAAQAARIVLERLAGRR
ncbi:MAG: lipid-A-disaccharide synthase [Wenzhouxiangellaceae bacterium]